MEEIRIPKMAEMAAEGKTPDVLFWVGCAGSYDSRAQKVTAAFARILLNAKVSFAILGNEESCTGDPARRAGNEFLFQMLAHQNMEVLNGYGIKKIVTACPHCLNTLKHEYKELGGIYEVVHHTTFLMDLVKEGVIKIDLDETENGKVTYHDSCYLGRINGEYLAPRELLRQLKVELVEMQRNKRNGLCCGAGGAQMWKEDEAGEQRINVARAREALETNASVIAVNCPFCLTMMEDGIKMEDKQDDVMVVDLAEMILNKQLIK